MLFHRKCLTTVLSSLSSQTKQFNLRAFDNMCLRTDDIRCLSTVVILVRKRSVQSVVYACSYQTVLDFDLCCHVDRSVDKLSIV